MLDGLPLVIDQIQFCPVHNLEPVIQKEGSCVGIFIYLTPYPDIYLLKVGRSRIGPKEILGLLTSSCISEGGRGFW